MKLSIVTPCSRPENLLRMWPTIPREAEWIIVRDAADFVVPPELLGRENVHVACLPGGCWGNAQRNLGMWLATGELLCFLDDDNVVHPNLLPLLERAQHAAADSVIVFNQVSPTGALRLPASAPPRAGAIDTGQVVLPRGLALSYWWTQLYAADAIFFSDIYGDCSERFVFLDEPGCYYNYLRGVA